jgi:uncharacterized phage-associated protein
MTTVVLMSTTINFQARAVAKTFLVNASALGIPLSGFKLIKLIYLAHRIMLDHFNRPLISSESFALWKYGPTLESLHCDLKTFEGRAIDVNSAEISYWPDDHSDQYVVSVIQVVLEKFGAMPVMELSDAIHKSDLMWRYALKKNLQTKFIDINPAPNYLHSLKIEHAAT